MAPETTRRTLFGTVVMAGGNIAKLSLQFMVIPVLARLLGPSSYGLLALAMPFVMVASTMCDLGLGSAMIRVREPSQEVEATVFWLAILVSAALALLVCALSWPASLFLSEPRLPPIMATMSLTLLFGGGLSVVNARISRERRFSLFAIGDVISSILSAATAIAAALAGLGAWSLVVQLFTIWIVKAIWLATQSSFRPALYCKPKLTAPYLSFGLNAAGSSVADLVAKSVPPLVVGGFLGVVAAGHYSMAYQIVRIPDLVVSGPVYLSVFTAVAHCGDVARQLTMRALRGVVAVLAPVFCGLAFTAHLLVPLLLGAKWIPTAAIVVLLTPAGFLLCLYSVANAALMGLGRSHQQLRLTVLTAIAISTGALIGARFGNEGIAVGMSIAALLVAPAYNYVLARELDISPPVVICEIAPPLVATLAMALVLAAGTQWMAHWNTVLQLSAAVVLGVASFPAVLAAISWRSFVEDLNWLRSSRDPPQPEAL